MAIEIKPGDRVWIPAEVEKSSTEGCHHLSFRFRDGQYADYLYSDLGPILDHPALPALLRLLAEHGDALHSALWSAIDCYSNGADCDIDKERVLNALSAALGTEESGDGK